ncbi:PH domain-containing protein [Herbiconiux sp. P16]|uniref:PH domain-containing protein n=1 Tax=Herbiconiux wuyangfengii TaxID=3342794 RepID=UPI0035BA3547
MARRTDETDSFTSVVRGPGPVATHSGSVSQRSPQAGRRGAEPGHGDGTYPPGATPSRNDPGATERFGWGAANADSGYTTSVEPLRPTSPEVVLLRTRPHARRLTLPVLVLFATVTAFGYFGGRFPEEWQNWTALGMASALIFFVTLLPFLAWLGHRYTVTSRRIIARRGILVRQRQDVYLARVTDVRLRRTPLQAAFASGDVRVVAGPDLTLILHDVPSARLVADLLGDLTEHPTPASHLP